MRTTLIVCFSLLIALILGCDDGWIMDLEPPFGGYIWRVTNGSSDYFSYGRITKYNPVDGSLIESYTTPFRGGEDGYPPSYTGYGYNYDAAAGDGRVWVAGDKIIDDLPYPYIWEVGGDDFRITYFGFGLTYDGEYLWVHDYGDYDGVTLTEFYRLDPDTHVQELMFIFDSGKLPIRGLAWDGTYLWALFAPAWGGGTEGIKEFVQFEPETGDVLHRAPCNIEVPLGLTWDGEALWVNDAKSDRMYRVSPKDGSILGYHEMSPSGNSPLHNPYGLAFEFPSE